jgi:hypothetical protein
MIGRYWTKWSVSVFRTATANLMAADATSAVVAITSIIPDGREIEIGFHFRQTCQRAHADVVGLRLCAKTSAHVGQAREPLP